jgi:hypothetical protein
MMMLPALRKISGSAIFGGIVYYLVYTTILSGWLLLPTGSGA